LRPIVWGLILAVLGAFFWILFSVVFGIAFMFSPTVPAGYMALIYITGLAMIFGIPGGIIGEIVRWYRRRKAKGVPKAPEVYQPSPHVPAGASYCRQCGRPIRPGSKYCDGCGTKI